MGEEAGIPRDVGPTDEERLARAQGLYEQQRQRAEHLEQELRALREGQRPGRDPLRRRGPPTHRFSIPPTRRLPRTPGNGTLWYLPRRPPTTHERRQALAHGKAPVLRGRPRRHRTVPRGLQDLLRGLPIPIPKPPRSHGGLRVLTTQGRSAGLVGPPQRRVRLHPRRNRGLRRRRPRRAVQRRKPVQIPGLDRVRSASQGTVPRPRIELVHEKNMGELRMTGPAYLFFRRMEREAKLANRLDDQGPRSVLVEAVRKGIPRDYSRIIADIGFAIPDTYAEWKRRITTMYEERTKDGVYAKTHHYPPKRRSQALPGPETEYRHQQQTSSRWRDKFVASQTRRSTTRRPGASGTRLGEQTRRCRSMPSAVDSWPKESVSGAKRKATCRRTAPRRRRDSR